MGIFRENLMKTLISIATIATIAFFTVEFRPSRSPSLIKSITKPECTIKGNIAFNNGNKVYHLPGMEDYESTVIDPAKGEKWFCTKSEAIANGLFN